MHSLQGARAADSSAVQRFEVCERPVRACPRTQKNIRYNASAHGQLVEHRELSTSRGDLMSRLTPALRLKLPFLIAGFGSFLFSVWLYFVQDEELMGIFVGLWVPSIHSLGTLLLAPTLEPAHLKTRS